MALDVNCFNSAAFVCSASQNGTPARRAGMLSLLVEMETRPGRGGSQFSKKIELKIHLHVILITTNNVFFFVIVTTFF